MTVKELFQSLDFSAIAEALIKKPYNPTLLPMSEYKEIYDIICSINYNGESGTITFKNDGDSDVYMIEGDALEDIVGMEVILPNNSSVTKVEAAADIIWSSGPFGRWSSDDWDTLFAEILSPSESEYYALQAKRIDIKMALPYCRDKNIRKELKREMQSKIDELCLSGDATRWFLFGKRKLWGKKHNRSKRKRLYRMEKRHDELLRLSNLHKQLTLLEAKIDTVPENLKTLIISSSSIETVSYESKAFGKTDRIDYIADLLLNPVYDSRKYFKPDRKQECICVLYTSTEHPCTEAEQNRIVEIIGSYFGTTPWQLFKKHYNSIGNEVELNITYITQ